MNSFMAHGSPETLFEQRVIRHAYCLHFGRWMILKNCGKMNTNRVSVEIVDCCGLWMRNVQSELGLFHSTPLSYEPSLQVVLARRIVHPNCLIGGEDES